MFNLLSGLSVIQKYITGGLLILILVMAAGGAWYFKYSQDKITALSKDVATAQANEETLKSQITLQNDAIKLLETKRKQDQQTVNSMAKKFNESQQEVNVLNKKLTANRLKNLTIAKPGLVEKIINNGTNKVLDEFESITDPDTFEIKTTDEGKSK